MSHQNHGKRFLPHDFKYPLFLLGLVVIILGDLGATQIGLGIYDEVAISAVGFFVMFLGIILE